jgi:hypothetical protein
MEKINIDLVPIVMGGKSIKELQVSPLNLAGFVEVADATNDLGVKGNTKWQVMNRRMRIKKQVKAIAEDGSTVAFDDLAITQIPTAYAVKLTSALAVGQGEQGKIISNGDGVTSPILVELGTPIKFVQGGAGEEIKELEFLASTFGDIEEVLAETISLQQALALIRTVAKPVGTNLQVLPSWAVEQITMADGMLIVDKVLPRFLGEEEK